MKNDHYHILFLFSDTGGGHRSATEAIIEAMDLEFGEQVTTEMVDVFKQYAPRPINHAPQWYPYMVRIPQLWGLGYHLSNGVRRTRIFNASLWPYIRRSTRRIINQHPSDLIVSVHAMANAPLLRAMRRMKEHPPFAIVVTDLVSTHTFWFHPDSDLIIVPTEAAKEIAIKCRVAPKKVKVVGLPVADKFCQPIRDKLIIRHELDWEKERKIVLLVGGGDGMGPIEQTARAIAISGYPVGLVIVCGRNEKLKVRLEDYRWEIPTKIYGYVNQMPMFMQASDVLVTKAGPGTISEALNAALPMILYSRLPGQEEGNVQYVVNNGVGVWAPSPDLIVKALGDWIEDPQKHRNTIDACRKIAHPQSAREIARILIEECQKHNQNHGALPN